jgi:hypothetical protein
MQMSQHIQHRTALRALRLVFRLTWHLVIRGSTHRGKHFVGGVIVTDCEFIYGKDRRFIYIYDLKKSICYGYVVQNKTLRSH